MSIATIEDRLLDMSQPELDTFPHGIIQLNRAGDILYYNDAQARLAHRSAESTIGLNFFRDVAPCTAVQAFQGRFAEFVRRGGDRCERFNFVFRFGWGHKEVGITIVHRTSADERIYIVVNSGDVKAG